MSRIRGIIKRLIGFIKIHKRISIIAIVVILILVFLFRPKNGNIITTQEIKQGNLTKSISVTGTIESQNSVNLTFQSGGTINYIGANQGDVVYVGQAIVSLDKQKLQATFRQAQQDFTAAKAASDQYYDGHRNATESYDEKVKRTALDATQNKAYDQMVKAQQDLNDSTLYSPLDGIVTRADVKNTGVNITAATVFTVTDPSSLDFEMDVDEADIGNVKEGQNVQVVLDSYPNETLNLTINSVDFVTHKTTTGGDAYTVKANLIKDNSNYKYRVGMNRNSEIILDQRANVVYVPLSSIFDNNEVYVKTNGKYKKKALKLGLENDTDVEVLEGLKKGEQVVVDPALVQPQGGFKLPF